MSCRVPTVVVPRRSIPKAIADSVRAVFTAHGLSFHDDLFTEIGNNAAQAVVFLDESEPS